MDTRRPISDGKAAGMLEVTRGFLRDLWALTRPYWSSEERWSARGLLAIIIALNLGMVYLTVLFNEWNNGFYNSLQNKDYDEFVHQILRFSILATFWVAFGVYALYLRQMLQIRWRRWMTNSFLEDWMSHQNYYRLQFTESSTDNPDQRISEDVRLFVVNTVTLSLDLMSNAVTVVSFMGILWGLSGALAVPLGSMSIEIPGYLVWVALIYSILGTWLAHKIGWRLSPINFTLQRYEADFRFSLVRIRENAEGVALYKGEVDETHGLHARFANIYANWWELMRYTKRLTWFSTGFSQVAIIFPYVVAAPRYFTGAIELGGLMQTASAFNQVQQSMSWFIEAYAKLAEWKATVDRLTTFRASLARTAAAGTGIARAAASQAAISLDDVEVRLPGDRPLLAPTDLELAPGKSVLISGPSGSGKSTLFRVLAGLWPYGAGKVIVPAGAKLLFLPQRPYLPLGMLRDVVTYPLETGRVDDNAVRRALEDCQLGPITTRLDEAQNWAQTLSPGEQQRVAFARTLLQRPDWLFLDEATAALDEKTEAHLYQLIQNRLPQTTIISIGHRPGLARFHGQHLMIVKDDKGGRLQPAAMAAQVRA
jgi:putative ATP-binding cassette transporter